jgi:hypothetical protein
LRQFSPQAKWNSLDHFTIWRPRKVFVMLESDDAIHQQTQFFNKQVDRLGDANDLALGQVQHRELERATLKDISPLNMVVGNLRGLSIAERTKLRQVRSFKEMFEIPIQSLAACEQELESAIVSSLKLGILQRQPVRHLRHAARERLP